jgi:soluble lytic murein transglycosylase-like protein
LLAVVGLATAGLINAQAASNVGLAGSGHAMPVPSRAADTPAPGDSVTDTPAPNEPILQIPITIHEILANAAQQEGLDPNLLLAVSFWESSWRQSAVSNQGAIGLLQVMPRTAATAAPLLLGRAVDLGNAEDNALMGAALLKDLLSKYDERTALAAYYQGEPALFGGYAAADTWLYADGIIALRQQIAVGTLPADPNQPPG